MRLGFVVHHTQEVLLAPAEPRPSLDGVSQVARIDDEVVHHYPVAMRPDPARVRLAESHDDMPEDAEQAGVVQPEPG